MITHPQDANLVLIGMPAAGKSTIGVLLAKHLSMQFLDTDLWVQCEAKKSLQQILDERGRQTFLALEEQTIVSRTVKNTVIATGGSVIYSEAAMHHLAHNAIILYIKVPLDILLKRLTNPSTRGLVIQMDQTLEALYAEREPYYLRYADWIWDAGGAKADDLAQDFAKKWLKELAGN